MLDLKVENQPHIDFEPPRIQRWYNRQRTPAPIKGETVTDDSFGNDTDINNIVERFARTGIMPEPTSEPKYDDVTGLQADLTELMQKSMDGKAALDKLQKEQAEAKANQAKADAEELAKFRAEAAAQEQEQQPQE